MEFLNLILFNIIATIAFAQTDFRSFISLPDKYSSHQFPRKSDSSSNGSPRRSRFFPPPDRLSPTLRPILNLPGSVAASTTQEPTLRFQNIQQSLPPTTPPNIDEYEEVYYEYYLENYGDEHGNKDQSPGIPLISTSQPIIETPINREVISKPLKSSFSKFHSGGFRFNTQTPRPTTSRPTTTRRIDPNSQRFRFFSTATKNNERTRNTSTKSSKRKGVLADLLSKLSAQTSSPRPNLVEVEITSSGPILGDDNSITESSPGTIKPVFETGIIKSNSRFRPELTTLETFTVRRENLNPYFTTTLPNYETTVNDLDTPNFIDSEVFSNKQINKFREEKTLKDNSRDFDNKSKVIISSIESSQPKRLFPSLLENIQIAVDPSLLPPGYAVEDSLTENASGNRDLTKATTKRSEIPTTVLSNIFEDIFTTTISSQDDITTASPQERVPEVRIVSFRETSNSNNRNNVKSSKDQRVLSNAQNEKVSKNVISKVDASSFLPAGYKDKTDLDEAKVTKIDLSKFLPAGFKEKKESTESDSKGLKISNVDISKFLPTGYEKKNNKDQTKSNNDKPYVVQTADISKFLPPGFKKEDKTSTSDSPSTNLKKAPSGIVFPRRPHRPSYAKTTTTTTFAPKLSGPPPIKPKIQNLFERVKAVGTTEYKVPVVTKKTPALGSEISSTTPSTTPTTTTTTTTTTVPTTTLPPRPTTPGVCGRECNLAASLRLMSGVEWKPELANRDTFEFQLLSNQIEDELDAFFRRGSFSQWYDHVEVDSFNKGSVIVSYILYLSHIEADVDTRALKQRVNSDLQRVSNHLGNFEVDPKETDFRVIENAPVELAEEQNFLIPEWLIAVIVIGLASFLFILIFGVVALVSRARVRKRANVPLTEEFLNNLNALQVNAMDNYAMNAMYGMEPAWNEKYPEKYPEKFMKPPSTKGKGYNAEYNVNIYDSWRTDYSGPVASSRPHPSKRRSELNFDGTQFYKDDPYDY